MRRPALLVCALAVALTGLLAGCDEEVTAVLGTDRPYSLFGVLSPQLDSQWVRVFPIEDRLEPATAQELDATFISTDLQTGEEHVWRDSLIEDAFGQTAHVFWAPFVVEYDHDYRLQVRHSSGAESTVELSVPPRTELSIRDAEVTSTDVRIPVLVQGGAPRLLKVEVEYNVSYRPSGSEMPTGDDVRIPYLDTPFQTAEGWIVPINLDGDFEAVSDTLVDRIDHPIDRNFGVILIDMTLHLIVANEEWNPPGGVFDPNVLVQPGTLSNVQDGFGFVGAGYRHRLTWTPEREVIDAAGFRAQSM